MPDKPKSRLTLYIAGAIVVAVLLAVFAPGFAMQFELGGEIFLNLLTMMVVPLVMASVMSGIIGLGDIRKLGRPGSLAVTYYLMTTVLAVIVGLLMVNFIQPGVGVDQTTLDAGLAEGQMSTAGREDADLGTILRGLVLMLFTDNLIESAAKTSLLPLILFSIIFAGMLTTMGTRVQALTEIIVQVNEALLSFILLLMKLAPFGIFCLVTARFGEAQAGEIWERFFNRLERTLERSLPGWGSMHFNASLDPMDLHPKEPVPFHVPDVPGSTDGLFNCEFNSNAADHDELCCRKGQGIETILRFRSSLGCHDQYGWHRPL